jgi:hypothetical protein
MLYIKQLYLLFFVFFLFSCELPVNPDWNPPAPPVPEPESIGNIHILLSGGAYANKILAGSWYYDKKGVLQRITADVSTHGDGQMNPGTNFVYARKYGTGFIYIFNNNKPQWDISQTGWYYGDERALFKFNYDSGLYKDKIILNSISSYFEEGE